MLCQQLAQAFNDPDTSLAFAWRSFEMYPLLAQVAGRARRPGAAHARPARRPGRHPRPRRRWPPPSTRPPGWSSSATRTTPPGRRCAGRSSSAFLDAVPRETLVVLDEAYREFVTDPDVPDGLELMRGRPNVVVLRTFSKAWGLAGLRVGYLIAEDPAVAEAVRKTYVPFSVSMLAQAAAVAALASEDEVRAALRRRRRRARPADRRPARARRGRRGQPGQLRLAAAGRGDRRAGRRARGRAVITRPFAGEGIRVTVGAPEEDDVFLAALDAVRAAAPVA